ncbi:hypothetical protein AB8850_03590, partial [Streptomyces griseorubens]
VSSALTSSATTGVVTSPGSGSPNRLLYVGGARRCRLRPAPRTGAPPPGGIPGGGARPLHPVASGRGVPQFGDLGARPAVRWPQGR